jgi:hypothetical protein
MIAQLGGETPALTMAAASLRAIGGKTRACLTELHIPLLLWSRCHIPPDKDVLEAVTAIVKPLDDPNHAKLIFGEIGEKRDGTGAAYEYIKAISEELGACNNRYAREIRRCIKQAEDGIGKTRQTTARPEDTEKALDFAKEFIKAEKRAIEDKIRGRSS